MVIIGIISLALSIVSLVYALVNYRAFRRDHTQSFSEKYFHRVPTDDHPAVLGCLWHGGGISTAEIKAELMHLTDLKAISLERIETTSEPASETANGPATVIPGGEVGGATDGDSAVDYLITRNPEAAALSDPLDAQAMSMLFDDLAPFAGGSEERYAGRLLLSNLIWIARQNLPQYRQVITRWGTAVQNTADARGFFDYQGTKRRDIVVVLGIFTLVVGGSVAMFATSNPSPFWTAVLVTAFIAAVGCFVLYAQMKPYPAEANAIKAKLAALRTWLIEVSGQSGPLPDDASPWNQLLVMAVILGVSNEIVDQLKAVSPQVLETGAVAPVYDWVNTDAGSASPGSIVDATLEAMKVSEQPAV